MMTKRAVVVEEAEETGEFCPSTDAVTAEVDEVMDELRSLLAEGRGRDAARAVALWRCVEGLVVGDEAELMGRAVAELEATVERVGALIYD